MGRPIKKGLSFFPLDVDTLSDIKILKLSTIFGSDGLAIYIRILFLIYKEGYYIKISMKNLIEAIELTTHQFDQSQEEHIKKGIEIMFDVGLFDRTLFETESILTSHGIQKRFNFIEIISKRKYLVNEYCLLSDDELADYGGVSVINKFGLKEIIYGKKIDNSEDINVDSELSTQIKENKKKENQTILNEIELNNSKEYEGIIPDNSEETIDDDDLPF